jgi:hypothetical protein
MVILIKAKTREFTGLNASEIKNDELNDLLSARIPLIQSKLATLEDKITIRYEGKNINSIKIGDKTLKPGIGSFGKGLYVGNFGEESKVNFYSMQRITLISDYEIIIMKKDKADELKAFLGSFENELGGNLDIKDPRELGYSCGSEEQIIVAFYFEGLIQKIQKFLKLGK